MEYKIFAESRNKIEKYIASHRLRDAFALTTSIATAIGANRILEEITQAEESYRYMLDYAARGADDPGRQEMVQTLSSKILSLVDRLDRDLRRRDTPSLYFSTLRYEALQTADSIPSLIAGYRSLIEKHSIFNFVVSGSDPVNTAADLAAREALEKRIFNRVWTVHPLSKAQTEAISAALLDDALPTEFRTLLTWALTLGGLQYYDENRLDILLHLYLHTLELTDNRSYDRLSAAAIIGVLLLMHRGHQRGFPQKIAGNIRLALSYPRCNRDIRTCYLQFAKTIDTDRISRKITDEIVPEMLKLKPQIDKTLKNVPRNPDPEEIEENPEWMDMLENSGLADKLKEMSEIQEEGGDVMMGTFSHLKTFPFFNDPYGWFLPFHADFSEFAGSDAKMLQPLASIIAKAPFLCDNDKFSFMLSLKSVPAMQRDMMMQHFQAQGNQLAEIQAATLAIEEERDNAIVRTVQNAFRFFKLFRRKGEFFNPFSSGINLVEIDLLEQAIAEMDILPLIAEFYFSHGYYPQAISAFRAMKIDPAFSPDDAFYQKLGYAYQKNNDIPHAIEFYSRAEMLNSKSDWTLQRLAHLYLSTNRPDEALKRYMELEKRNPQKPSTALHIGLANLQLGNLSDALRALFKAEYLGVKPSKVLRPLAWALLLSADFSRARKYYERIITDLDPTPTDYLNMGHLALAENRFKEALNFYSLSITLRLQTLSDSTNSARSEAIDGFISDIKADTRALSQIGVDPTIIPLLIDSLLYNL